jgi:hypothetical protein
MYGAVKEISDEIHDIMSSARDGIVVGRAIRGRGVPVCAAAANDSRRGRGPACDPGGRPPTCAVRRSGC